MEHGGREPVRSRRNPLLKLVRSVAAGRERGKILLEGERLVRDAIAAGVELEALLVEERVLDRPFGLPEDLVTPVADGLLQGLGSLKTSPGVVALAREPNRAPAERLRTEEHGLWLCAAGLADPSNLGAAARSAEAAGASGLVVSPGSVQPYHPRAIRASMGSLLRLAVVEVSESRDLDLDGLHHRFAATRGGTDFRAASWPRPLVLWLGDELGRTPLAPPPGAVAVTIPMAGATESLNAATAAALLLFEATRG